LKRFEGTIAAHRRTVALAPHHAHAHSPFGILLLMRSDFAEGRDEYKRQLHERGEGPRFPQHPWQGESLGGRQVCIPCRTGLRRHSPACTLPARRWRRWRAYASDLGLLLAALNRAES
jgi:hypothetical protein